MWKDFAGARVSASPGWSDFPISTGIMFCKIRTDGVEKGLLSLGLCTYLFVKLYRSLHAVAFSHIFMSHRCGEMVQSYTINTILEN